MPADDASCWTLAELIDFEGALATWDGDASPDHGDSPRAARFRQWLHSRKVDHPGRRWLDAIQAATLLLATVAAVGGAGAVWGSLQRETAGVNVVWMLASTLVLPWLLFVAGGLAWMFRGRIPGIGLIGRLVEILSLRFVGSEWRSRIQQMRGSGELTRMLAWHIGARTQLLAAAFHAGAFAGLGAMVLFKRVGFFWESTTEQVLQLMLETAVDLLSWPWAAWLPQAVPDVAASRSGTDWMTGGNGWWSFSLGALFLWGFLPRVALAAWMVRRKRRMLRRLAFQAPRHRRLWRALAGVHRGEDPPGPADGALVILIGGAEPDHDALRPFLLRRLRMNPTGWESLGVLDQDREETARAALARAPAGIVLFAEGWSLAPKQMERALAEVTARTGDRRQVLVVGDPVEGAINPVTAEERAEWERFVDERAGPELELFFYERP